MPTSVVVLQIDDSSDKTIVGQQTWDRSNGGILIAPFGTSFPITPVADELFWRSDLGVLYFRDSTNTVWVAAGAVPTGVAGGDLSGSYPNPDVVDLTILGEQQGSTLFFDGTNWIGLDPGSDGYVLTTHGVGMDPTWEEISPTVGGVILFGNNGVTATTTTRYLSPGVSGGNSVTNAISMMAPRDGVLQNLYIRHNATNGNGNAIVYTVRINGIASTLAVSLASTSAVGSDLANTVSVSQGDTIDIEVTKALSVVTSPSRIVASMEFM